MGKVREGALRIRQRRDESIVKAALHPNYRVIVKQTWQDFKRFKKVRQASKVTTNTSCVCC